MATATVVLRRGRERSVLHRHPWIYSGSVAAVTGPAEDGAAVDVVDAAGALLAKGVLNRRASVVVRILSWDAADTVDEELWRARVRRAVAVRDELLEDDRTDALRLVHAEADGAPGLVVDRYGSWLVVQANSLAADAVLPAVVAELVELVRPTGVFERSDEEARRLEGLEPRTGPLWGPAPPAEVEIRQDGLRYLVDLGAGHKTGFYLDQRDNRRRVAGLCCGAEVLNVFSYTGAFTVAAARSGATAVTEIESSPSALDLGRRNLQLNGLDGVPVARVQGDAFVELRRLRDGARSFDGVILDPPKFAPSRSRLAGAMRGYKDVNLLGLKLVRRGGFLATFSCSAALDRELLQTVLFQAAVDARREVRVIADLGQPPDHPVLVTFPESRYLKGLLCRVD